MAHYDIAIVGGGLVGAGLIAALKPSSLRLALIDAKVPIAQDPRLFALNNGSCQFLQHIGVWDQLSTHASPIHQVHVSRRGYFGNVTLQAEDVSLPNLGFVIPAHYLETALYDILATHAHFNLYQPALLTSLKQDDEKVTLTINTAQQEQTLTASLVIGADGTESTVRKLLGIETDTFDYGQSALVTRTRLQRSHAGIAYERFTQHGTVAMLPLVDNECATIWSADNNTITSLLQLSETDFLQQLQKTFGYRLGRLQNIKQRFTYPLRMLGARKRMEKHVFLLGNAAHTLHPVAAQGLNLALYEVATLAEAILTQAKKGALLSATHLEQLSAQIEKQQGISMGISHRLAHCFDKSHSMQDLGLQFGMICLDNLSPLKKGFLRRVLGKTGQVPRLLLRKDNDYII